MVLAVFQILLAVILVALLLVIGFAVYSSERTRAVQRIGQNKKESKIFEGIKDLSISNNESYNTLNPAHPTFRDLEPSINQKAGAEYTYNFWMYIATNAFEGGADTSSGHFPDSGLTKFEDRPKGTPDGTAEAMTHKPFVVLLRGDKNAYAYKNLCKNTKADVLVKNPIVKIENQGRVLSVEINTLQTPDGVRTGARDTCGEGNGSWNYMNSHRMALDNLNSEHLVDKWFMVTLVVRDTYPMDSLPMRNKVHVCIYINGVNELDHYLDGKLASVGEAATVLKNAPTNLYVAPTVTLGNGTSSIELSQKIAVQEKVMIADLSYFNFAVQPDAIAERFRGGFTKKFAAAIQGNMNTSTNSFMDSMSVPVEERILRDLKEG